jgi:hypothetical protein
MIQQTTRLGLPMLVQGQSQKDVTHNEALLMLDALLHLVVEDWTQTLPPAERVSGQCWIVPPDATGDWTGRDHAIAQWTEAGWRYFSPLEGMAAWLPTAACLLRWRGGAWLPDVPAQGAAPAVTPPNGGAVVDAEARATIAALVQALTTRGLIVS